MITFCKKCKINWARLWSEHDALGDEEYEFCPHCGTDRFLEDGNDIVSFIKCPITGQITNKDTGELYIPAVTISDNKRPVRVWDETKEEYETRRAQVEDEMVRLYAELRETVGDRDAYMQVAKIEFPERKYHME